MLSSTLAYTSTVALLLPAAHVGLTSSLLFMLCIALER
jgi:hypothetical protein